jgi:hypothetical protein
MLDGRRFRGASKIVKDKFMKKTMIFILLICSSLACANDGLVVNSGGGIEPINKTDISIEREDLIIAYSEANKNWHVSVSFILYNPTESSIMNEIAFINHGYHELKYNGDIINFKTWINNKLEKYSYSKSEAEELYEDGPVLYKEFFTSKIVFNPGYTVIKHEYDFVGTLGWGPDRFGFGYTLTTANKWNGPIKHFNLLVNLPSNSIILSDNQSLSKYSIPYGEYKINNSDNRGACYFRNGGFFYTKDNYTPDTELRLEIYDWKWYLQNIPVFYSEEYGESNYGESRISFYDLSTRKLTKIDLKRYSKEDIRILRNAIYAIHGYTFNSEDLKKFFNQFIWYIPNGTFKESELNAYEKYNIDFLKN